MNRFDLLFQKGSLFRIALGLILAGVFAQYALIEPDHRYISLFVVIVTLTGVGRDYVTWWRRSVQSGKELLDTDPDT